MTKQRSEWRDPWLLASVVAYGAFWLTVLAFAIHHIWTQR